MLIARYTPVFIALIFGIIFALITSMLAVNAVETRSSTEVTRILDLNGYPWTEVNVDGLQVILGGFAPDEAERFRALKVAGTVVDTSRLIDAMNVLNASAVNPPRFSIEILRNNDGISLMGLIPSKSDHNDLIELVIDIAKSADVTDLLDTADFPEPEGWDAAVSFGIAALSKLPRSKISIGANTVEIRAIADSIEEKRQLESDLARQAPAGLKLAINVTAPRPVISPYTLRFIIDAESTRFDACSTFTPEGREQILSAARKAGMLGKSDCTIGLGIPSPTWDDAVVIAIKKLKEIGGGSVTFSDADVTLIALDTTSQEKFDEIVGDLRSDLPDAFSLHAVLPDPVVIDGTEKNTGPPEFVATKSPEGDVRLRGRITDDRIRVVTESYAQAQFGSDVVTAAMRIDPELPDGWSTRVLASLEALAQLNSGSIVVQPDVVEIRGLTGNENAKAEVTRILSEKLGASQDYRISITYQKILDEQANIPTPEECVDRITKILEIQQIIFTPSSAEIDEVARVSIDNIAEILKTCPDIPMEVGGHTDSQGREIMNQQLSQARALSVVNALLARRILTSNLTAKGYGESRPIADNKTESGREENRRIEFRLVAPGEEPIETEQPVSVDEHPTEIVTEPHTENTDEQN